MATSLIGALGGAAAMYFLDPDVGRRRRALVRDQTIRLRRMLAEELQEQATDVSNRARGLVAAARRLVEPGDVPDRVLAERVRSSLGALSHPRALEVEVEGGRVHLRGPILTRDVARAVRLAGRVGGVREVVNELEQHDEPGSIPALQGAPRRRDYGQLDPATRAAIEVAGLLAILATPLGRIVQSGAAMRIGAFGLLAAAVAMAERSRVRSATARRRTTRREPAPPATPEPSHRQAQIR
jgi:hypothetical protein